MTKRATKPVARKPKLKLNEIIWNSRGFFPLFIGFCPSAKAWDAAMKRMKIDRPPTYPTAPGSCTSFEANEGRHVSLVTLNKDTEKRSMIEVMGLVTHESVHVYQELLDTMGERTRPSSEFEAYTIQCIAQEMFEAYCETRRPQWQHLK